MPSDLVLTRPSQLAAIGHPVRTRILLELELEPRSAKQLAAMLGMTHGRIDHHLGVLEREGFVSLVDERRVRGVVERTYAPAFTRMRVEVPGAPDSLRFLFAQAAREAASSGEQPFEDNARLYSVRMPVARAAEFAGRLVALADEFAAADGDEGVPVGLAAAIYTTRARASDR